MNDPTFDSLEQQLRALRPVAPSDRLASAIGADLTAAAGFGDAAAHDVRAELAALRRRTRVSLWASWSITAMAASVALAFALRPGAVATDLPAAEVALQPAAQADASDSSGLRVLPVESSGVLFGAQDEGLVYLADGTPARKLRYQYVDTVRLVGERDPAAVSVSYPREEVRLVPLVAY